MRPLAKLTLDRQRLYRKAECYQGGSGGDGGEVDYGEYGSEVAGPEREQVSKLKLLPFPTCYIRQIPFQFAFAEETSSSSSSSSEESEGE